MKNILIFVVLIAFGCTHTHKHEAHNEAEEEALSFTQFSPHHEMFTEISALESGQASEVIAHFTILENYKPVEKGRLTAILKQQGNAETMTFEKPVRSGIFVFEITPGFSGEGELVLTINDGVHESEFSLAFLVSDPESSHQHEDEHQHAENEITYLKEQAWKTDFGIYRVQKEFFPDVLETSGEVLLAPDRTFTVIAKHSGVIVYEKVNLVSGMQINPEEDLMLIVSDDILHDNFEVKYKKIKIDFEKAAKDFDRAKALYSQKIMSEKEYLEVKNSYENLKEDFDLMKSHFKPGGHDIHLKKSGYIKEVFVKDGQYVEIGQPLLDISINNELVLRADVRQQDIGFLTDSISASFKLSSDPGYFDISELSGELISIGQATNNKSYLLPVFFSFTNPGSIVPGSFVEVKLLKNSLHQKIAVPSDAIIENQGYYYVIVQQGGESYEKREVTTGETDGHFIEIMDGLAENEVIVSTGAYRVYLASMASELPEHAHVH